MGLRGDTLRLGLLPPLRGGRLAWPAPRAWDYPNPALPPYDVKTPHTWSPAYGGYIGRRGYLQDGLCVYLCVRGGAQEAPGGAQEQPGAAQEQPGAAQEQPRRSPEATFDVILAGRGGPKVKKLRVGSILTTILGQQHTEIGSKSVFLNKC